MEIRDYITQEDYYHLKKEYYNAVENNDLQFIYKGNLLLTAYVKYLLEFLRDKFTIKED